MTSRRRFLRNLSALSMSGLLPRAGIVDVSAGERARLSVPFVARGDTDYDRLRDSMVWHLSKPDRHPALIVQVKSDRDVIEAVNYARVHGLRVAVRGRGHSSCSTSLRDDSLLINLADMRGVAIDRQAQTASAQPAISGGELSRLLANDDLAFPVGHCSDVPLSGYLLGGGLGWNRESWGDIACNSVLGADVVTASGELLTVNADQHADLFWALRGAGPGFFGVVTRYYLQLFPRPPAIFFNSYVLPQEAAELAAAELEKHMSVRRPNTDAYLFLTSGGETDEAAESLCLVRIVAYANTREQAEDMLGPFADSPIADSALQKDEMRPTSLDDLMAPENYAAVVARTAADNIWTNSPTAALSEFVRYRTVNPSSNAQVMVVFTAGQPPTQDSAFSKIAAGYFFCVVDWYDPSEDAKHREWLEGAMKCLVPFRHGLYINETDHVTHPANVDLAFSPAAMSRLQALRDIYDPSRVFHDFFGNGS